MTLRLIVRHRFPAFELAVAFTAPRSGITVLFGPSGAGKSTVLAAAAGLLRAAHAELWLDGEALHTLPAERRGTGFVFQDGRLFPHLNVAANLHYGMRRRPGPGPAPLEVAALLDIEALLARRPATLSGGERQRVALGRALLARPRLLLMDEPLASLDKPRRLEILPYLRRLADRSDLPILYVTHERDELVRLADHVVLIEAGKVTGSGALTELASRADLSWARRNDAGGVLRGKIAEHLPIRCLTRIVCDGAEFLVPALPHPPGTAVRLSVPAREVILARKAPAETSVNNMLPATVLKLVEDAQGAALVELACGRGRLLAKITQDAARRLDVRSGVELLALVKSVGVEVA